MVKANNVAHLEDIFNANKKLLASVDGSKNSLLHWAAQYSSKNSTKLLIQQGADLLARNKDGATPFHNAANYNRVEILELLAAALPSGINAQDTDLFTPLHYACLNNGFETVKFLTNQVQINVNLKNKNDKKPDEVYSKTRDDIKKLIFVCRVKS